MKITLRARIDGKRLRRALGMLLLAAPFFLLLSALRTEDLRTVLTHPYWDRAVAERATTVPRYPPDAHTVAETGEGTLDGLPLYELFIKPNSLYALQSLLPVKKEHEPFLGFLPESGRVYQPASFAHRGRKWKADIRFRGDSAFHWMGKKQSWRIKFPKDDLFNGVRRIDLINPKAANCISDYMAMRLAQGMGLMAPDIRFVNLWVNHRRMGVYQETELIEKFFLQKRGRSVGNIYGEKDKKPKFYGEYPLYTDVAFWRKHCEDPVQAPDDYTEMARLIELLNDPADEVFREKIFTVLDRRKFYVWNCHALLCSSGHQDWFHNARLYYDPARDLFEFIPWDLSGFGDAREFFFDTPSMVLGRRQDNPLASRVLRQGPFRHERDCLLWGFVKNDDVLTRIQNEADRMAATLRPSVYHDALKEQIGGGLEREGFSNERFEESVNGLKYTTRVTFHRIRDALKFNDLKAEVRVLDGTAAPGGRGAPVARVGFVHSASSAAAVRALHIPLGPGSRRTPDARLGLYEDTDANGRFGAADRRVAPFAWDGVAGAYRCGGGECLIFPDLNESLQPVSTRRNYFVVQEEGRTMPPLAFGDTAIDAGNAVTGEEIQVDVQLVNPGRGGGGSIFQ